MFKLKHFFATNILSEQQSNKFIVNQSLHFIPIFHTFSQEKKDKIILKVIEVIEKINKTPYVDLKITNSNRQMILIIQRMLRSMNYPIVKRILNDTPKFNTLTYQIWKIFLENEKEL